MLLFPQPRNMEILDGTYQPKHDYSACDLVSFFKTVQNGCDEVSVASAPLLGREEYRLNVDAQGLHIEASCEEGLFRAATSAHQLLRKKEIPFLRLNDKPDIARRGYMLDISCGRMPRMETIKGMKLNF